MTEIELKIIEIRLTYIKSSVTFFLAIAGGLVAIVETFFPGSEHKVWIFVAVVALALAALVSLTIAEATVRRISEQPTWNWLRRISEHIPDSVNADWMRSGIAGLCGGVAVFAFCVFVGVSFIFT